MDMARLPRLLTYAVAWLVGATLVLPIGGEPSARGGTQDLAGFVDPFIGTGTASTGTGGPGGGHVFPGAVVPHGMVQWSPDPPANAGGYRYWQSNIRGFGVTHFSGRGCRSYQDFPFMPHVGPMRSSPASNARSFTSSFSHRSEQASPGSYRVRLDRGPIHVALTAGARSGLGAFTYPASRTSTMLIDAGGSATGNIASGTGIRIVGDREIVGRATSGFFCGSGNRYRLFLAARFDRPVVRFGTWEGDRLRPATRRAAGSSSGAYVSFDTTVSRTVRVKVGLSFV